jgi:hypothetical protein
MRPLLIILLLACSLSLEAKPSEWTNVLGNSFKGEPLQALGPMALFRTSSGGVRWELFRSFSVETIQRFYREAKLADPAPRWADTKAAATAELVGRASHLGADGKLAKVDFTNVPEPQLLLVLYGPRGWGDSVTVAVTPQGVYRHLQALRPGQVEFVFLGDKGVITWTHMPWYTAGLDELAEMRTFARYAPKEDSVIVLMTRNGQVLMSERGENYGTITKFLDAVSDFLWKIDPANPEYWLDRLHYLTSVRPIKHAQDASPPVLLGVPFKPAAIRSRGISRISATLQVDASGKTTNVKWPIDSGVPESLQGPLKEALMRMRFAPAIDHGVATPAAFEFAWDVPEETSRSVAERAWYSTKSQTEIPITSWLVLKPIPIPQEEFSESGTDHTKADGTVVMKSLEVSSGITRKTQVNAFNSNWFDAAGAGSVQPTAGDRQVVDGTVGRWQKVAPDGGYVNLADGLDNSDYCVGYAWTEVDVPDETDALFGIGSDDGIKIWVNGTLVHDQWVRRPCKLDEDIVPLRLKQGKNSILIKIQNMKDQWGYACRLRPQAR